MFVQDILVANYVIITEIGPHGKPSTLKENQINLTLKLFFPTSSGIWMGFQKGINGVHFVHPRPYNGPFNYLLLKKESQPIISRIFNLVTDNESNKKFKLASNLYSRALDGDTTEISIRFVLLTTALEILYLPDKEEATHKLALRVANLLASRGNENAHKIFKKTKEIYKIRSKIVHSGETENITANNFFELTRIVRASLIRFLEDKKSFEQDELDKICLKSPLDRQKQTT